MSETNRPGYFEAGVSRHAPKQDIPNPDLGYDVSQQEVDHAAAEAEAIEVARSLLDRIQAAPRGAIMALEPSNVLRARQTRDLLVEKLTDAARATDIELVEIGETEESAQTLLAKIQSNPDRKFIITDVRATKLIGFTENDKFVPTVNKWKTLFRGNEDFIGKLWSARRDEIQTLHQELQTAGFDIQFDVLRPQEFAVTPERIALKQIHWVLAMKRIGEGYLADRPMYLEGISHNLRADFMALALLGEEISLESVNRILGGHFRQPFERSAIVFTSDGNITINFKDQTRIYTEREFNELLERIRSSLNNRQAEWSEK